jgi:soluble lytic murein transglycosylase-like protein
MIYEFEAEIKAAGKKHGIDPELINAVIMAESAGDPNAIRFEYHNYLSGAYHIRPYSKVKPKISSLQTERMGQSTSWGLMQVMGFNARGLGFRRRWLVELCRPDIGIDLGCKILARLLKKYDIVEDAVSAYNQGSPRKQENGEYTNQAYVDHVMGRTGGTLESRHTDRL